MAEALEGRLEPAEVLLSSIVNSLGGSYDPVVNQLLTQNALVPFGDYVRMLEEQERVLMSRVGESRNSQTAVLHAEGQDEDKADIATIVQEAVADAMMASGNHTNGPPKCHNCGKLGHKAHQCWNKPPGNKGGGKKGKGKGKGGWHKQKPKGGDQAKANLAKKKKNKAKKTKKKSD